MTAQGAVPDAALQNPAGLSGAADAEWVPLGIRQEEDQCDQPKADGQTDKQQKEAVHPQVRDAGYDCESDTGDGHHHTAEEMR